MFNKAIWFLFNWAYRCYPRHGWLTLTINYSLIGKRIKEQRIKKGLTQENIAEYLDISVSYISRIERAAVKISLDTLVRIAVFLDVSPAFLIDGTIAASGDYLQGELADVTSGFSSDQMNLLLDIAQALKKHQRWRRGDMITKKYPSTQNMDR